MKAAAALLASLLPALAAALPQVEVSFGDLARFDDLKVSVMSSARDREALAADLRRHIEREAPGRLPQGARLKVHVGNVDMAGEYWPVAGGTAARDMRIVKDEYPPRIDLEFELLRGDGSVERSGRRELRGAGFLQYQGLMSYEPLRHEKNLLDGWLRKEFGAAR
jgi:hypothetical protein